MRVRILAILLTLAVFTLVLSACGGSRGGSSPAGNRTFPQLEKAARGTTVNFFMYGGDNATNSYVDDWVTPRLKKEYGITLKRTPVSDTADVVNKLLDEKQAGKQKGTADLVWVNGENFYTGSQAGLWFGPWAKRLPNAKYIDWNSPQVERDFGYPASGYEAPWSQAQFIMIYNSSKVKDPPKNLRELEGWVKEHPGRFTYPAPPDFTGNAFLEQLFYQSAGTYKPFQESFDHSTFEKYAPDFYRSLNGIEPNLWRKGETYPNSSTALDDLYRNGEVDFDMSYNPYYAQLQVEKGIFPKSTRAYLFDEGTLSNTSYVAIPFDSPNKAGAQVVANFLQSPRAQLELQSHHVVGGLTTLDPKRLPEDLRKKFAEKAGKSSLPLDELQQNRVPEARSKWLLAIQNGWISNVQRKK